MPNQTNQTKEIGAMSPSSIQSGDSLLGIRGGSVLPLTQASFKAADAAKADVVTAPVYTYSGSTIADFCEWLKERHGENKYNFRQFHASFPIASLNHFSDTSYSTAGTGVRCTFTRISYYDGVADLFGFIVATQSKPESFFIVSLNRNELWSCYKYSGTQC